MTGDDDVHIRLLHTSDWHLGFGYPGLDDRHQRTRMTRQRLTTVEDVLHLAERYRVDAVLCAGDLFDRRDPSARWWNALAELLSAMRHRCPVVLLPGNHDYLDHHSVWSPGHPFRDALPAHVHVVDRDDWTLDVGDDLRLYARPVRTDGGADDPMSTLPRRSDGDPRFRVALAHGLAIRFSRDHNPDFPIAPEAGLERGFDYVALGDFHSWREVRAAEGGIGLTHYCGTPEPMRFGEDGAGRAALVELRSTGGPRVHEERVGRWRWRQGTCSAVDEVAALLDDPELEHTVLRLTLDMAIGLDERRRLDELLDALKGDEVRAGAVGVLQQLDESRVRFVADAFQADLGREVPSALRSVHRRLRDQLAAARANGDGDTAARVEAALGHLMRMIHGEAGVSPGLGEGAS